MLVGYYIKWLANLHPMCAPRITVNYTFVQPLNLSSFASSLSATSFSNTAFPCRNNSHVNGSESRNLLKRKLIDYELTYYILRYSVQMPEIETRPVEFPNRSNSLVYLI